MSLDSLTVPFYQAVRSMYLTKFIARGNSLYTKLTVNEWTSKVASGGQVKASLCGGCTVHSSTKTRSKCKNENLHDNVHGKVPLLFPQGSRRFGPDYLVVAKRRSLRIRKELLRRENRALSKANLLDCKIVFNQLDRADYPYGAFRL